MADPYYMVENGRYAVVPGDQLPQENVWDRFRESLGQGLLRRGTPGGVLLGSLLTAANSPRENELIRRRDEQDMIAAQLRKAQADDITTNLIRGNAPSKRDEELAKREQAAWKKADWVTANEIQSAATEKAQNKAVNLGQLLLAHPDATPKQLADLYNRVYGETISEDEVARITGKTAAPALFPGPETEMDKINRAAQGEAQPFSSTNLDLARLPQTAEPPLTTATPPASPFTPLPLVDTKGKSKEVRAFENDVAQFTLLNGRPPSLIETAAIKQKNGLVLTEEENRAYNTAVGKQTDQTRRSEMIAYVDKLRGLLDVTPAGENRDALVAEINEMRAAIRQSFIPRQSAASETGQTQKPALRDDPDYQRLLELPVDIKDRFAEQIALVAEGRVKPAAAFRAIKALIADEEAAKRRIPATRGALVRPDAEQSFGEQMLTRKMVPPEELAKRTTPATRGTLWR